MNDPAVLHIVSERGISEILHFTTNNGLVGILRTGRLSANAFLKDDQQLSHILKINSIDRSRDASWLEYINLSISRINDRLLGYSKSWQKHEHAYWCILSFDAEVMSHPGVVFGTTNNAYELTSRAKGAAGLEALFAGRIARNPTWTGYRTAGESPAHPTCRQAEVLYPQHLSLAHLRAIYVESGPVYDEVYAQVSVLAPLLLNKIQIVEDPSKFK
jgi:hypothetical protein